MEAISAVVARDVASFDPDLLQLQEVPLCALYVNHSFFEELYCQWLSLSETSQLLWSLIEDAKLGAFINATKSNSLLSIVPDSGAPLMPPRSTSSSPQPLKHSSEIETPSVGAPLKCVNDPILEFIPQFYFQNGCPAHTKEKEQCISRINHIFFSKRNGLQTHEFKSITVAVCKLPSFLSTALFGKIDVGSTSVVTRDAFVDYWVNKNIMMKDKATQIFTILKQPDCNYLVQDDFKPVLQEVVQTHPGLEFLKDNEYQDIYVETVIYRIFYYMNRSGTGRLTMREFKRGDLIEAMQLLDEEPNVTKVLRYFSYEHFYVIYCKFMELDTDNDLLIDHEDLITYGNYGLSNRIVSRIFSQVPRKFSSSVEGKMCYEDFVHFILSEEDKSSEPSIEFWFKCIDMDENGVLTRDEMQFFYMEQSCRLECMAYKPVSFEDIWCQIIDMIQPENEGYLTLSDLKGSKLSKHVFNILFNLNKFMAYETRDSFLLQQERDNPTLTDWDLFAQREYATFVMEELVLESSDGEADDSDIRL